MLLILATASISFVLAISGQQEVINSSKELVRVDKLVEDWRETATIRISAIVEVHQLFLSVMPCCTSLSIFVLINFPYCPS